MLDEDNNFTIEQEDFYSTSYDDSEYQLVMGIIHRAIKDCLSKTDHPDFANSVGAVSIVISKRAYSWLMNDEIEEKSLRWYLQNLPVDSDSFVRKIRQFIHIYL